MSSYKTLPLAVLEVILWVPEKVLEGWFDADPEGATSVAIEATRRLEGTSSTRDPARLEDEHLVARLVISGGDEVDLLRLAASGLIGSKGAFHKAATWVKRRRTAHAIIHMPEAQTFRQRLLDGLGPLGWDNPDVPHQQTVLETIRTFESALMAWYAISKAPTAAAMRAYIIEVVHRAEFGVGRATTTI